MANAAKCRVYIAEKAAIHGFDMDLSTGALTAVEKLEKDGAGSYLAISDDGMYLYSLAKPGAAAFKIDQTTGNLTHINSVDVDISGGAYVSTAFDAAIGAGVVLTAAYGGGGVNVVRVAPDGSLMKVEAGASKQHGAGSNVYQPARGNEQEQAHPHSCNVEPSGKWAVVSDMGQDKVYVYGIDFEIGRLQQHTAVETAPGAGPRHMCFHPGGVYAYGINELDCTINVYEYAPLRPVIGEIVQTISTLPEGYNNRDHKNAKNAIGGPASGPNRPDQTNAAADIHITPDGRYLYGSNRGHDSIVCYEVGEDGRLTLIDFTYVEGEHPRGFRIHPSGEWLVVANQDSNNVVVFKLDRATGCLTFTGHKVDVKTARCVLWKPDVKDDPNVPAKRAKISRSCCASL